MSGKWIKDGFITYGSRDWHYFPHKGRISACNSMIPHQRGWDNGVELLPESATSLNTCKTCRKESAKYTVTPQLQVVTKNKQTGCGKKEYFSETEATRALVYINKNSNGGRRESRVYFCNQCASWHLTSQAKNS